MFFNMNKQLFKNEYVFSIITKLLTILLGMGYAIIFARYVGAELKGEMSYISSIVATGSTILTFGIHHAYPYYRRKATNVVEFRGKFVSTCTLLFVVYAFLAGIIAVLSRDKVLSVSALLIVLWTYNRVLGYVVLVETPNKRNRMVTICGVLELVFIVFLYFYTSADFTKGVIGLACVQVFYFVFYFIILWRDLSVKNVELRLIVRLFTFGFLPMIALLLTTLNYRIDIFMLKGYSYIPLSAIGVYSIGIGLAEKVLLIPDAIQEILLSHLAKDKGAKETARVCRLSFIVSLFVAMGIVILGKPFIDIFYGTEYSGAYLVSAISVIGTPCMVFFKMISQYNIIKKKQLKNALFLCVSIIVNVLLNLMLVPVWGIYGAAVATAIGSLSSATVFVLSFCRDTGENIRSVVLLEKQDIALLKSILGGKKNEK